MYSKCNCHTLRNIANITSNVFLKILKFNTTENWFFCASSLNFAIFPNNFHVGWSVVLRPLENISLMWIRKRHYCWWRAANFGVWLTHSAFFRKDLDRSIPAVTIHLCFCGLIQTITFYHKQWVPMAHLDLYVIFTTCT